MARTGRRPGVSGTRAAILAAARDAFAERGYGASTIRDIAARADVDPALVHHYFDTKEKLFAAAMELPVSPGDVLPEVLAGELDGLGERLVGTFLSVWDVEAARRPMLALLRSASSNRHAARLLREFVESALEGRIAARLDTPDGHVRASLVASQMIGLGMARYVVALEPLASLPPEAVVATVGPTIQRYLTGDLVPVPQHM